jgi:hypothetical protein
MSSGSIGLIQNARTACSDLDAWLEKVEALGELKRISAQVDPDLEAATITISWAASRPRSCSRTSKVIRVSCALQQIGCNRPASVS